MYRVRIKNSAKSDLKKIKYSHLKGSFDEITKQLKSNPFEPNQGFEKIQPPIAQKYSRRLNVQHRVVYSVDENNKIVSIYSAWSTLRVI